MTNPIVPGYTDLEKIGAGGFAVVYKATQAAVGRPVALKLLHNAIADEDTERRFQRECIVVGSLSWHPHIAAVLDAGSDEDGRSYLAFELLVGGSIGDRLQKTGPLPWPEAVVFAIQTADALAAAHEQDVLHRDVKPDNILIDRLGRAKLADFGIAAMRDGTQTKTGVITATLAHAAPEVLSGKRATKLSDVYLLGSTLYEMIAGEPPFGTGVGDDFFAAIQRIATEPPPPLASRAGLNVPAELSDLVDRSLRKDPHERFESAAAMGMALRELQGRHGASRTHMPFAEASGDAPKSATALISQPESAPRPAPPSAAAPLPAPPAPAVSPREAPRAPNHQVEPSLQPIPEDKKKAKKAKKAQRSGPPQRQHVPAPAPKKKRSRLPAAILVLVLAVGGAAAAAFFLLPKEETPDGIVATEVKQTDSAQGFVGGLVIDGDLSTGWLSPTNPNGHELVIGFGKAVILNAIVIHSGPDPTAPGPFDGSRGVGLAVLEFSDGTEMNLELNESVAIQRVEVNKTTASLGIRSIAPGFTAVAIREVEFVGPAGT